MGTYVEQDWDTDGLNAAFLEVSSGMDLDTVKAEWIAARTRMLKEWDQLEEVTPPAEEWFEESSAQHYEEHMPDLRRWAGEEAAR